MRCTLLLSLLLPAVSLGYYPPGSDVLARPRVHGILALRSLEVLRGDGHEAAANFFERYRRALVQGTRDADRAHGNLTLEDLMGALDRKVRGRVAREWRGEAWAKLRPRVEARAREVLDRGIPRKPFTHFHDPLRNRGFTMELGRREGLDLDRLLTWLDELALLPWEWWTLVGPHASARDMADLAYAEALDAMRSAPVDLEYQSGPFDGDLAPHVEEAVRWLGEALHLVADATVPHHAANDGDQHPESNHGAYEGLAERVLADVAFPHAGTGALEEEALDPGEEAPHGGAGAFVLHAARASRAWIDAARGAEEEQRRALRALLPLAERLGAGLMLRFYQGWEEDRARVVAVRIREVSKVGPGDALGREDYRARVTLAGAVRETGALRGADVARPQALIPDAWLLAAAVPADGAIPVLVEAFERDLTRDRAVDLDGALHRRGGVELTVDTASGEVGVEGGDPVALLPTTRIELAGDAWTPPAARVVLDLELHPWRGPVAAGRAAAVTGGPSWEGLRGASPP